MYDSEDTEAKTRVTDASGFRPTDTTDDALVLIYPPGADLGKKYELNESVVTVGREPSNDIVVDSDSVSRRHARLSLEGSERVAYDIKSTNGTYVNNEQILSRLLKHGDQLKIGDTIFKYLVGSDVEAAYHEEIYRMTIKDGLTEIYNKRYFMEMLEREISRAQRYGRELSVILFDIDFFKKVNDTFGHLAGDHVLQSLARAISSRSRREEIFARYGGEEFVILLPETTIDGATELAEQLRKKVADYKFAFEGEDIPVTISLGVAHMIGDAVSPNEFIKAADEKLYEAKSAGRNCVRS